MLDEERQSGTRRKVAENEYTNTLLLTKATIQLKNYDSTFNEELLFIGWNTEADGSGTTYGDGKSFTPTELNELFGARDTVVLYAQWELRNIYIAGDSFYNAMKGNAYNTKGLEELMTYNTWVAINKLGKSDAYGVYPDTGGYSLFKYSWDILLDYRAGRAASCSRFKGQADCQRDKVLDTARRRGIGAQQWTNPRQGLE